MKTITSLLMVLLLLGICPFELEGEAPKVEQAPDTECADCINHDLSAKYVERVTGNVSGNRQLLHISIV